MSGERCPACGVPVPAFTVGMRAYHWRIGHAESCPGLDTAAAPADKVRADD